MDLINLFRFGQSTRSGRLQSTECQSRRIRPLRIEPLEDRRMLAQIIGYGFEESSGNVLDAATSNGSQDGALLNGAARVVGGVVGAQAISLDGTDDKVSFSGTIPQTDSLSGVTLAAWINPNALSGNSSEGRAIVSLLRGTVGSTLQARANVHLFGDGRLRAGGRELDSNGFQSAFTATSVISAAEASGDVWIHVAAVIDYVNNTVAIYKNGAQVLAATTISGWAAGNTASNTPSVGFVVGSNDITTTASEQFGGLIDDVQCFNTALTAAEVQNIYASTVPSPPAAPSNLAATGTSSSQIQLTWVDHSTNESGFKIERKQGAAGAYQEIVQVPAGSTMYSDNAGLAPNTQYFYQVRAFNAGGNSPYSNEDDGTTLPVTPPIAPSNLNTTVISGTQITLTWADNSTDESGFKIERKQGAAGMYQEIGQVGPGITTFLASGLTANTEYTFRVKAFNTSGESAYSNESSNTTNNSIAPPSVSSITPSSGTSNVLRDAQIIAEVFLPNSGIDELTLSATSVRLVRVSDSFSVPSVLNTSGGGDIIVLRPQVDLDANTLYRFEVTSALKDLNGQAFAPFQSTFTTGTSVGAVASVVQFEHVALPIADGSQYTCLTIGPDGKLYGLANTGQIFRWNIETDGTLSNEQMIDSLRTYTGSTVDRLAIGLKFDPASTANNLIAWVTHTTYGFAGMADFGGKLSRLSGPNLETVQDYLVNLPRSARDHVTNQIDFGPDGKLYYTQGSLSAMGAPDAAWNNRREKLLSAAVVQVNTAALKTYVQTYGVPLDAYTGGLDDSGNPLPAPVPGPDGKLFDPFNPTSPVQLYATGVRNAYDLVWHSNGSLYVGTNGSASGGNSPGTPTIPPAGLLPRIDAATDGPYTGPAVPAANNNPTQPDLLFKIVQGKYYGHPNASRNEFVLNGGNPTAGADPLEIPTYPVGTLPDRNYGGIAFNYGSNFSPDGIIEYKSKNFGGALTGRLLNVRYSAGDDIIVLTPGADGNIVSSIANLATFDGFVDPLVLIENTANGMLYVAEYGGSKITLLRPQEANISVNKDKFYFNDPIGGAASNSQTVTITNSGNFAMTIPAGGLTLSGADAGQFTLVSPPTLPLTIAPGNSSSVQVAFAPSTNGVKIAMLNIQSNDADTPTLTVQLRGLGHPAFQGDGEPPLRQILDLFEIPTNVGFTGLTTPYVNTLLGEEVPLQTLRKAGPGNITIEPLASFGPASTPDYRFGWYLPGQSATSTELFTAESLNPAAGGDDQTVNPIVQSGVTQFDPGTQTFGIYAEFPSQGTRRDFSENALNTWDGSNTRKMRFWPLKDAAGNVVPNAYIVGMEEATNNDLNDVVVIIRNVTSSVIVPGDFDRDGHRTAADIPAMLNALTDLNSYRAGKNISTADLLALGDLDGDHSVTNRDLQSLLTLLKTGGGSGANTTSIADNVGLAAGKSVGSVDPVVAATSLEPTFAKANLAVVVKSEIMSVGSAPVAERPPSSLGRGFLPLWTDVRTVADNGDVEVQLPNRARLLAVDWAHEMSYSRSRHLHRPGDVNSPYDIDDAFFDLR
jgi:hypothetical protein